MIVLTLILALLANGASEPTAALDIQLSLYPYYHHEATAWRVEIRADGTVAYLESKEPVKVSYSSPIEAIDWVIAPSSLPSQLSSRQMRTLYSKLNAVGLTGLESKYSAQFSYPSEKTAVVDDTGEIVDSVPGEAWTIVTHGAYYGLRISGLGASVDTVVYSPVSALEWTDPEHPKRADIQKIISAWFHVLKTTGPVNDYKARHYRKWLK